MQNSLDYGIEIIKLYAKKMDPLPGIYRMINDKGEVLYVGKAKNLPKRIINYTHIDKLSYRLKRMVAQIASIEFIITETEVDALILEANLIKSLQPKYNILLKDDKSFSFIAIKKDHNFPQIIKYRGKKDKNLQLFGPFASAADVKKTINELQQIFLLRPCSDNYFANRKKPCLQYQIKRCSAPCVNKISKDDYKLLVNEAEKFLKGKTSDIQKKLAEEMQIASTKMEYEKAASIRDRIKALSYIQAKRNQVNIDEDLDVIAFYRLGDISCVEIFLFRSGYNYGNKVFYLDHDLQDLDDEIITNFFIQFYQNNIPADKIIISQEIINKSELEEYIYKVHDMKIEIAIPKKGEKYQLIQHALDNAKNALENKLKSQQSQLEYLSKLKDKFNLPIIPYRVEVYDNSHISGTNAIGAMIVATRDGLEKKYYRKFNIHNDEKKIITGGDDYEMMRIVLRRRFTRMLNQSSKYEEMVWPDFMIIDGGKGHMNVVEKIMKEFSLNIPFVCIAKGVDRNSGREDFYVQGIEKFKMPEHDSLLMFIQRLRDEAHRFAITSHRNKRNNLIAVSELDKIPNIGKKRKIQLLNHFGSFEAIKNATINDLMAVHGISQKIAKQIRKSIEDL